MAVKIGAQQEDFLIFQQKTSSQNTFLMLPNNETKNELKESYKGLFCWLMIGICFALFLIYIASPLILAYYGIR